jgi:hypothetical protein
MRAMVNLLSFSHSSIARDDGDGDGDGDIEGDGKGEGGPADPAPNARKTMRRRHGIVSLEAGTLRANVRRAIAARTIQPPLSQQEINTIRDGITQKIIDTMKFMTRCRRWMHWAIELFIADANTTPADYTQLMTWSSAQRIVYGIGRYLSMTRADISADTQWPVSQRIVLQALNALATRPQMPSGTILPPHPRNSSQVYILLVRSIFQEYSGFFLRGEEALEQRVTLI